MIDYKYREDELIRELQKYVDATYGEHYSTNKYQATEFIIDGGHGMGFAIGNILKYAQRYGKKDGYNRKDLLKVLHYAIIALYVHDEENSSDAKNRSDSQDQNRRDRVRELHEQGNAVLFRADPQDPQRMRNTWYEIVQPDSKG